MEDIKMSEREIGEMVALAKTVLDKNYTELDRFIYGEDLAKMVLEMFKTKEA